MAHIGKLLWNTVGSLLDDEADIPPSLTLPVEQLTQLLKACDASSELMSHDPAYKLQPSTEARLRTILQNSRIVEGFLDEMGGAEEESDQDDADQDDADQDESEPEDDTSKQDQ